MSETKRCEVCDWPLAKTMEGGCIEGNCSYRPHEGTAEYFRIRKRREELAAKKADASIRWFEPAEPVIEVAPGEYERCAVPETWDTLARQCILSAKQGGTIPDDLYDRALAAHKRETVPGVPAQEAPREPTLTHDQICILSRKFHDRNSTAISDYTAINEWLKWQIERRA